MNYPITRASINLTRSCNLACDYCFAHKPSCHRSMTFDVAQRAVDWLIGNAKSLQGREREIEIAFWGGEPLLEWSLLQKIVCYAEEKGAQHAVGVRFSGTTNGTLLTPEKFDFLDTHKIFFLISWDGTPETHNKYRHFRGGRGSAEIIEINLKEVLKKWPFYQVRMSPYASAIGNFFNDVKYIFDFGINKMMFSPVYESNFTDEDWRTWEEQCYKVVDYIASLRAQGRQIDITHFSGYMSGDASCWPCGAGRFYVGIDVDGAIYPCHRFNKFDDMRPWEEKEVCIGHIDRGITRPEFRQSFIDFHPQCGKCPHIEDTPCHGGCYAINFDFTGHIDTHHIGICKYVDMQKRVSKYYKEKVMNEEKVSCMPYLGKDMSCGCYNSYYTGTVKPQASMEDLITLIKDLHLRVSKLESK